MLNSLIKNSLANRIAVLAIAALLLFYGMYTASRMQVDVFPDLTAPTVTIITEAPGLAPEEVERLVTFPIESSVNGAEKVRRLRSASSTGLSMVWVEFEWGMDTYISRQLITERLSSINNLPPSVTRPVLAPNSSIMGEIMFISVTADDDAQMMRIRSLADWNIRPRLLSVPGVAQVIVFGGEYAQYQIIASPEKMQFFNVSMNELIRASEECSMNGSGGIVNQHGNQYILKGIGQTGKVDELARGVIKIQNGSPVTLQDVAEIRIAPAPKIGEGALSGKPAVILTVQKQARVNTLELTKAIDSAIADLKPTVPKGILINNNIFRQSDFIQASINNVSKTLWEGALVVAIVLFVFMMNWRATAISLIAIPLSLITAVITLKWLGFTINTMSLGGMAIAIGDVVDDAIIDVENVLKRLKQNAALPLHERKAKLRVIYDASLEIRSSVINATFIIIIAFLPLFFLTGIEGRLLMPLGVAFIVALFASLVVALTLTPALSSYLLTVRKCKRGETNDSWLVNKLMISYEKILSSCLKRKKLVITLTVAFFGLAIFLLAGFGRSFLPEFNEGSLVITATTRTGSTLDESSRIGTEVEKQLLTIPEVRLTSRRTGRAELDEHTQGSNVSEVDVPFILKDRTRSEFVDEVRHKLAAIPGAYFSIGQPISHRIDHILSGSRSNLAIKVFGPDLHQLHTIGTHIKSALSTIPGLVDVNLEQQSQIPQIQLKVKRDMLAAYGITTGEFARFMNVAFQGEKVGTIYDAERQYPLMLRFDKPDAVSLESIRRTLIDTYDGRKIPIHYVADIISTVGPNAVARENVERHTIVAANISGRDQSSVITDVRNKLTEKIKLPEGYRIEYGGQFEAEKAASKRLLITSLIAIAIIYLMLFRTFKSFKTAGIVLINLPLALIGGIMTIAFTSGIITIPAIIGFITLFGVAIRNGILLVSRYEKLRYKETNIIAVVMEGSKERLSPILMTALTAGLALIPLAMAGDLPGNEIQSPMAKVILGGLITSTLLNLIVIPVVYQLVMNNHSKNEKGSRFFIDTDVQNWIQSDNSRQSVTVYSGEKL